MAYKKNVYPSPFEAWDALIQDYGLGISERSLLEQYVHELMNWNKRSNLTRITDPYGVVEYHIRDSLVFAQMVDCTQPLLICDVGTGGGLPGIPLKICYPNLKVILLEVVDKKIAFLNHSIQALGLQDIEVCSLDWRTFVRSTDAPINYFLARASLRPDELLRVYKPGTNYNNAQVVYWASDLWQPGCADEEGLIDQIYSYKVGDKVRKLISFCKK